jgi:hypothetical protein
MTKPFKLIAIYRVNGETRGGNATDYLEKLKFVVQLMATFEFGTRVWFCLVNTNKKARRPVPIEIDFDRNRFNYYHHFTSCSKLDFPLLKSHSYSPRLL